MDDRTSDVDCAEKLKVLANDTRLNVVQQLMDGPRHVHELNAELQIDKTLLSHHLKILRDSGIVEAERCGKEVEYRLAKNIHGTDVPGCVNLGCCQLNFGTP